MPPPTMKRSTRYLRRLPPALSTSCTKGSFWARAISCARIIFWPVRDCMAPALMPESFTAIMQRTPLMWPMPTISALPGTLVAGSGSSRLQ